MTTDNSLFNNDNTPAQDPAKDQPSDANGQPSLFHVGEAKKYGSVEELDKAYGHANEHIGRLEQEANDLREQLEAATNKQSAVDKVLEALNGKPNEDPAPQDQPANEQPALEDVVAKMLAEREAATAAKSNQDKVRDALAAKYGEKAGEVYAAKGTELGINLDDLTKQSADAVLQLFGTAAPQQAPAPQSTYRAPNLHTSDDEMSPEARYKRGEITRDQKFRLQWETQLKLENS